MFRSLNRQIDFNSRCFSSSVQLRNKKFKCKAEHRLPACFYCCSWKVFRTWMSHDLESNSSIIWQNQFNEMIDRLSCTNIKDVKIDQTCNTLIRLKRDYKHLFSCKRFANWIIAECGVTYGVNQLLLTLFITSATWQSSWSFFTTNREVFVAFQNYKNKYVASVSRNSKYKAFKICLDCMVNNFIKVKYCEVIDNLWPQKQFSDA